MKQDSDDDKRKELSPKGGTLAVLALGMQRISA